MKSKASKDKEIIGSNLLLESFVKYSPVPIQIHSADGLLIDYNPAYARLFSLSESIMASLLNKYNVLEDMEAVKLGIMPYVEKAFAGEVVSFPEYEYDPTNTLKALGIEHPNVEKRWIKTQGYSIKDEKERVTHIVFISENITARKKAEIASIVSEQKFKDLFEQSPIVHEIYDRNGMLVEANTAFEKLWNLKKEDTIGKYNVFESKQIEALGYLPHLEKAFSGEIPIIDDLEFDSSLEGVVDGKGEKKWVSSWLFPMKDIDGKVTHVVQMHQDITEKKIAEKELLDSHLFTDNLIQSANIMIVGIDTEGKVNIFNPAAESISGYTFDEIKDKDWFSTLVPKEKYTYVHEEFNRLMEGGTPKLFENPILSKNGEERIISWSNNEIIKNDKTIGVLSFGIDITEQKIAEKSLFESEENYRALVEQANDGIVVIQDGTLRFVNSAITKITGYSTDELLDSNFLEYIKQSEIENVKTKYAKRMKGEPVPKYESKIVRKDGEIIEVEFNGGLTNYNGTIADLVMVRDITERKKAEEERNRLFNLSSDLIGIAGFDGVFKQLNPAWRTTLGYSIDELMSKPFIYFIHPDDIQKTTAEIDKLSIGQITIDFENRYFHKDGSIRHISWTATPLVEEKTMYCIGRDITERKKIEVALIESEEKFRELMSQAPYAISITNPDGRIDQVNQAFMKLWGFTAEAWSVIKENYNLLEDAEAIRLGTMPLIEKAFNGENVELPLIEYISKNTMDTIGIETTSNTRWIHVRLYPIKNSNGDIVKVVNVAENITLRRQAEIALRESEAGYRNLIEQNPQLIEVYTPNGQLVKINNAYCSLIGINDETIQWMYENYNLLEDKTTLEKGLMPGIKKVFSGEHVVFHEYEFDIDEIRMMLNLPVQNKGKIWMKSTGFPIKNEAGDITQLVFLSNDVSQRYKAEKQILQYQQSLKDLALELTYAEEKQRKQIATDLHDHVGQLLASSRLQIAAINERMDKTLIMSKMKDVSSGLMDAVTATRNAIFELSPPQLNEIGLMAAISDWVEEEMETKHGIKSTIMGEDRIFAINNEERYLLFRCVRELLINIIKHARANYVTLNVFEKNDILNICVHDNGIGFDYNPDMLENKDFGFGLFSIRERIQNIGGSLEIKSSSETGTRIKLKLPLKK